MNAPGDLFDFEGQWTLTRTIRDARAGQVVQADGTAVLRRADHGLVYDEEVTLRIPGQAEMKGTRRYMWHADRDGIAIHFDDGRYFHRLKLGLQQVADHHDCAPDSYDATYDFEDWPRWNVRWVVSGPRKSYEMDTQYVLR
jgi:hypothetical protein